MRALLLFDIDGTLLTCGGAGRRALGAALEALAESVELSVATARGAAREVALAGRTDRAIVADLLAALGLGERHITGFVDDYLHRLEGELARSPGFAVLPGVRRLLGELAGTAHALGIGTGNLADAAALKLRRAELEGHFAFGGYGSDAHERAELIRHGLARGRVHAADPNVPALVIGDTPHDVRAAHANGVPCLAVASGHFDAPALAQAGAERVVTSLAEVDVDLLGQLAERPA